MDSKEHNTQLHTVTVWRNLLLVGVGLSLIINILLGIAVLMKSHTTILVPSPAGRVYQIGETVNASYLEDVARDVALTVLNIHPGNTDYVRDAVLKMAHPSFYGDFKRFFDTLLTDIRSRKMATAFYPTTITAKPDQLTVHVTGTLKSFIGKSEVDDESVSYRIAFNNTAGRLTLTGFEEEQDK